MNNKQDKVHLLALFIFLGKYKDIELSLGKEHSINVFCGRTTDLPKSIKPSKVKYFSSLFLQLCTQYVKQYLLSMVQQTLENCEENYCLQCCYNSYNGRLSQLCSSYIRGQLLIHQISNITSESDRIILQSRSRNNPEITQSSV